MLTTGPSSGTALVRAVVMAQTASRIQRLESAAVRIAMELSSVVAAAALRESGRYVVVSFLSFE